MLKYFEMALFILNPQEMHGSLFPRDAEKMTDYFLSVCISCLCVCDRERLNDFPVHLDSRNLQNLEAAYVTTSKSLKDWQRNISNQQLFNILQIILHEVI